MLHLMKITHSLFAGAALCALVGVGCAPPPVTPMNDAAVTPDAAAPTDSGAQACTPPTLTNECVMEGCQFAPLTLPYCDGSGDFRFYQNNFCSNQLTLVVIAAGWCVPCQQEAAQMQDEIISRYAGRVRVVTVYGQNVARTPASPNECMNWKNRYGLESDMVYDATGMTQRYFPNMAFPANMIIDREGVIRHRVYGTSQGLQSLKDQIDGLLQ
jgi:thiol-disulfide isomerase/thioredoxin